MGIETKALRLVLGEHSGGPGVVRGIGRRSDSCKTQQSTGETPVLPSGEVSVSREGSEGQPEVMTGLAGWRARDAVPL